MPSRPERLAYDEWRMTASAPRSARIFLRSSFSSAPTYLRICIPLFLPRFRLLGRDHAQGLDLHVLDDLVVGQHGDPGLHGVGDLLHLGADLRRAEDDGLVTGLHELRDLLRQPLADAAYHRRRERDESP